MISTSARGASRGLGGSGPPLQALAAGPAIVVLLLGGLVLRLTIAYVLFPASGFETDVASYASWALTMAQHGPGGFYANAGFVDYPPAYLWVLWPVGLLAGAPGSGAPFAVEELVKLPPMLLDLVAGYVLYRLVLGWTWPGARAERVALAAAALYVFNPLTLYDSALWGQTDAAGAVLILLGVAALIRGNPEGSAALAVAAALVKPQFGVVLLPLVAAVLVKRHLLAPGSGPRHQPWAPAPLAGWLREQQGPVRLGTAVLVALATFHVLALPFGMDIPGYLALMVRTAGGYAYLTVNAYNLWALVGTGDTPAFAWSSLWIDDSAALAGPLPGVAIGAVLLVAGALWAIARASIRDDRWTLIVAALFLCIAFFALPTRVHERYLFPAFALLPLLAAVERRWLLALLVLGLAALVNLHGVLTTPLYGSPGVETLPFGEAARTTPFIILSAISTTVTAAWVAWEMRPRTVTRPDAWERLAVGTEAGERGWGLAAGAHATGPGLVGHAPAMAREHGPAPAGPARGRLATVLGAWLSPAPVRADRSAELVRERPGRLDRLDLLLVTALVAGALTLRGARVDEPYDMYFDEVYHARTATEFLQHWRYGEPHAIYEYTHPHLAKYLMAAGIVAAGGNQVTDTSSIGVPVAAAVLERRWAPAGEPGKRLGDRLFVATGDELRVVDPESGRLEATIATTATALAVDEVEHLLYLAETDGALRSLDTSLLDAVREGGGAPPPFVPVAELPNAPITRLVVTDPSVVALGRDGRLVAVDLATGRRSGSAHVDGASDVAALPATSRLVADTASVGDPRAAALVVAEILGGDADRIERRLRSDAATVVVRAPLDKASREALQGRIDEGTLPGLSVVSGPLLAVSGDAGLTVLDAATLDELETVPVDGAAPTGLALSGAGSDETRLYAAAGGEVWVGKVGDDGLRAQTVVRMPGQVRWPLWNEPAGLLHVVGWTAAGEPTIYVIEPHGHAVYADAPLPDEPVVALMDTQPDRPSVDRGRILAIAADGDVAGVGVLGNAFGWRLPGVLMGALTVACLFILARLLFARRTVAVAAGLLALAEGMLFANSRIAMNDVYVTGFIVAAVTVFTPLYLGVVRRGALVALGLVAVGGLLGLALSSKWVALYAIGALVLLVLLRSTLGRLLALAGMAVITTILGAMAIGAPDAQDPARNWLFLIIMLALTGALAAAMVRRPVRIGWPPPLSWVRPGARFGLPWLAGLACIGLLPIVVYVASYTPWVALGNQFVQGFPTGHEGQTLLDLTRSMYEYHDGLRVAHAASSPWWAWPLDLKPVWFFQDDFAGTTTGQVYDAGNLVVLWLGIAGLLFAAWAAWARRSLSLAIVVVCFAALWLPWARIDRATFQYHYYASLPFLVLALAYFLAELWNGPGRRTWALARMSAALAIVAAPLLWLMRTPLCLIADTNAVNAAGAACRTIERTIGVSEVAVATTLVLAAGLGVALLVVGLAGRHGPTDEPLRRSGLLAGLLLVTGATLVLVLVANLLLSSTPSLEMTFSAEQLALLALALLAVPAVMALRARDARRFVVGVLGAAALWLLVWYPNLTGLPLPRDVAYAFQALLPTWYYDFQFAVDTGAATEGGSLASVAVVVGVVTLSVVAAVVFVARAWGPDPDGLPEAATREPA